MTHQPAEAKDYFLACYTVSLVQGQTIKGTLIRHATIKNYLGAAYEVFGSARYTSEYNFVGTVLKAVKSYEDVPRRRRMITDGMMQWMIERADKEGPDSATRAMVDWIILGRYTGFRASEWSQTTLDSYARLDWPGAPSRAMTRQDFEFLGDNERHLPSCDLTDALIRHLTIRWRHQKNGQNGQQVTFAGDSANPAYSATGAGLRIYMRSLRLGQKAHEPLAVFKNKRNKVQYITDSMVNSLLRDAASATLGLPRKHKDLKL